ncbi:MAG: putative zinc protease AlbF [Firmicutes bacterium ADurb.BinA052]|nr:MAG: putative zinc protease AlbF [Firmicutes bacterium ADurb.BinA052]
MLEMGLDRSELLREEVAYTRLGCGLEVATLQKRGFAKKYAVLATRYGSIDTKFRIAGAVDPISTPEGIAHFLEHKLFEEEDGSIDDVFADLGAYSNAFTNYTMTGYLFSCVDNFWPAFDTLLDFVMRPHFTDENVEKEKGIIEQEIRMNEDSPDWQAANGLLRAMYRLHPVREEIAGTVDSVRRITAEMLYECYRTFYHPSNMTLLVVGDVSPSEVAHRASTRLDGRDFGPTPGVERIRPEEPRSVGARRVERRMTVSEPIVCFGYKDPSVGWLGQSLMHRIIGMEMLMHTLAGRSSALYNSLYAEGLIDASFDWDYDCEHDYGFAMFEGRSNSPDRLVERVAEGIDSFLGAGVDPDEFERTRRRVIGSMLRSFDSLEFIAYNFLTYHFRNMRLIESVDMARSIGPGEAEAVARELFSPDLLAVSVVTPDSAQPPADAEYPGDDEPEQEG